MIKGIFEDAFSTAILIISAITLMLTPSALAQIPQDTIPYDHRKEIRLGLPNRQDSIDMGLIIEIPKDAEFPSIDSIPGNDSLIVPSLLPEDSLKTERNWKGVNHYFKHDYPNPRKAFYFSLIVPGGGQIYNKRYWKLPFVYAIIGGAGYSVVFNNREYRKFRTAYENRVNGIPDDYIGIINSLDKLKAISDSYRSSMELSYVFLIGGYLFTAAEALVDAHLKTFDISEDLSFQLRPFLTTTGPGIGVVFSFK